MPQCEAASKEASRSFRDVEARQTLAQGKAAWEVRWGQEIV